MTNDTVEFKTMDNTKVRILKASVGAIEEIQASVRSEGYVKIYVGGFAFHVRMTLDEATKLIYG